MSAEEAGFQRVSARDAWNLIWDQEGQSPGGLVLFDVRDEASFARSHLEHARHLTEAGVPQALAETPKSATVVVYCYHGVSSQGFAAVFGGAGFTRVFSVDGGFEALSLEHLNRSAEGDGEGGAVLYLVGDMVIAREAILNDGGVPDVPADALVAEAGARGVVVQVGRAEVDPAKVVYAVRFEAGGGELGPMVGCLPDELTQDPREVHA